MRAATILRFGGSEEFAITDLSDPRPGPGEVLVEVAFAGVNPLDFKIRDGSSGLAKKLTEEDFPLVLGEECSGRVADVGEGVSQFQIGDAVFGMVPMTHGCYAEFAVFPADALAKVPEGADLRPLGGAALAGLTAWTAVHDLAGVQPNDTVLIHGGGGGVGQLMVQMAVATGATVFATASARHKERITRWGASHIDYATTNFEDAMAKPDVIIDAVYFGTYERSVALLQPGDRLVVLPTLADLAPARAKDLQVSVPSIRPDQGRLERLAADITAGRLEVVVSAVLPLEQVAEAHRIVESGHAEGKVLLELDG